MDVGEFIVPIPHVKQVKLSNGGGRLIIASDGIWDALSSEIAAESCRRLPSELAARQVVKVITIYCICFYTSFENNGKFFYLRMLRYLNLSLTLYEELK